MNATSDDHVHEQKPNLLASNILQPALISSINVIQNLPQNNLPNIRLFDLRTWVKQNWTVDFIENVAAKAYVKMLKPDNYILINSVLLTKGRNVIGEGGLLYSYVNLIKSILIEPDTTLDQMNLAEILESLKTNNLDSLVSEMKKDESKKGNSNLLQIIYGSSINGLFFDSVLEALKESIQ